jgi:RNA polymerase sigma factor (sigma-70 family)
MLERSLDALMLERFLRQGDETAFAQLMAWHGPMVFAVCRRVLRHTQDAEDACQATFLVLARKASAIGRGESIGGWLHTVAFRLSLRLRRRLVRRTQTQRQQELNDVRDGEPGYDPPEQAAARELRQWLDAELLQIPEKYRTAFILCHLEGKTSEEAAAHLGCPRGTVQSRVGRARQRLRARLTLPQP